MSSSSGRVRSTSAELAGRSFLYGFAGVAGKAAALITVPYLARQLGPVDYGLADLATSTAAVLGIVVSFSGDLSTARALGSAFTTDDRDRALRMYVVMTGIVGIAVAILLLPLSAAIAGGLWSAPGQTTLAALAVALVPISALQAAVANLPRLRGQGRRHAAFALVDLIAQLAFAVLFVAIGMGPAGVVAGFIVGSIVGLVAAAVPVRSMIGGSLDLRFGARLVRDGIPYLPALVLPVVADFVTRVLLANRLSTAEVGEFGVAIRVASVMSLAAGAFTAAYGPDFLARDHSQRTLSVFRIVLVGYIALLTGIGAVLAFWAREIVDAVTGGGFQGASGLLPWLAAGGAVAGTYALLMLAAGLGGRTRSVAWTATIGTAVQVAVVAVLVGPLGGIAAGVGMVAGQVTAVALLHRSLARPIPGLGPAILILCGGIGVCLLAGSVAGALDAWVRAAITIVGTLLGIALLRRLAGAVDRRNRELQAT